MPLTNSIRVIIASSQDLVPAILKQKTDCFTSIASQCMDLNYGYFLAVVWKKMCTQWRKAHRRILSVPSMTHCKLLPLIANNVSMETRLDCKYLAFYKAIATSRNSIVNYVARSKLHDHSSTMGKNMNHLMYKYNISVEDILQTSKKQMNKLCYQKWTEEINAQSISHANIIKELIKLKEGNLQLFFTNENFEFSYDAYNFIIYSLCVN